MDPGRIHSITLDDNTLLARTPEAEHERATAIADLVEDNRFMPVGSAAGPYGLHLRLSDNRLVMEVESDGEAPTCITLPISPLKRIIRDYFMICDSYVDAIKHATSAKIETIDMARRGLHNEGATKVLELFQGKAELDDDTARRFFTLICVLHIR